ncbi:hypothetical protein CISIN_1g0090412mg, partial [Citrus sinensis]
MLRLINSSGGSLRSSAMSPAAATTKMMSSSTVAVKNPRWSLCSSNNSGLFSGHVNNRVSFRNQLAPAMSFRCFASATGIDRVKVQNPIVEMD